jgi:hypothetical protein
MLCQLGQCVPPVLLSRLLDRAAQRLFEAPVMAVVGPGEHLLRVQTRVPDLQVAERRELPHRLPVGADDPEHRRCAFCIGEVALARRDLEARGESLHVPLERPGKRLVEVVEVEDEIPLGRGEAAEVHQVGIARELGGQAARRSRDEVVGHDDRGAAEVAHRRLEHPAVTNGNEVAQA